MTDQTDPPIRVERFYYPDGTLKEEIHYKRTLEHGPWRKWHPNGQLAEEWWFELGVYTNCTNRRWHNNGQLADEWIHVNEKMVSARSYSPSGKLILEIGGATQAKALRKMLDRARVAKPRKAKHNPESAARLDAFANELLQKGLTAEARQWLIETPPEAQRTLGEFDAERSRELVNGLYELGAIKVLAVTIEESYGSLDQSTNHLLVQLPEIATDPNARARLFAIDRRVAHERGFDAESDCGQMYSYLMLC